MTSIFDQDKPSLAELAHHGVKGMHWGERKSEIDGVSSKVNRDAKKDAEEHTRAKLFYGEGAGTRRKLIKATVEAKSQADPTYKKAFDHHVANTDLAKRAEQAHSERKRQDAKKQTGKFIRGTRHILNGNSQYASATVALVVGGVLAAHRAGIDKIVLDSAKKTVNNINPDTLNKGRDFLRSMGMNA